jgi:hypothetical protein
MGNIELNVDELLLDLNNPRFDGLAQPARGAAKDCPVAREQAGKPC